MNEEGGKLSAEFSEFINTTSLSSTSTYSTRTTPHPHPDHTINYRGKSFFHGASRLSGSTPILRRTPSTSASVATVAKFTRWISSSPKHSSSSTSRREISTVEIPKVPSRNGNTQTQAQESGDRGSRRADTTAFDMVRRFSTSARIQHYPFQNIRMIDPPNGESLSVCT